MPVLRRPLGRRREERRVPRSRRPGLRAAQPPEPLSPLPAARAIRAVVFDLDGTLLDSDEALATPFVELGVAREDVTFGHVVAEECARLGLSVDDYLARYDVHAAPPFAGVDAMLTDLPVPWAVCSNKMRRYGVAELERLGWAPAVALFSEDFGGPKRLAPVVEHLGVDGADVLFVGDTEHDRVCARDAGATFVLAGWNPRAAGVATSSDDEVLSSPRDLLRLLGWRRLD